MLEMAQTISGKSPKIVAPAAAGHIPTSEEIRAFLQVKTGTDPASLAFADNTSIKVICDRIACF